MEAFDQTKLAQALSEACADLPFSVSAEQQTTLLAYLAMMHKWNKAYNLTSVRSPSDMLIKHIVDSIAVLPHLRGKTFIDVGTGPGLPGIPLSIIMPDRQFTLLDSLGKRVRFMKQCAYELKLENIHPVQSRVEAFNDGVPFDGVLSRAFASLKDMLHWCQHLVDSKGHFFALKGQYPDAELSELDQSFTLVSSHAVHVPGLTGERHVIVVKKENEA
jgi:16S rRNA (guanine527-N7)-methyltransferase